MVDWGRNIIAIVPAIPEGRQGFPARLWELLLHPSGRNVAYWVSSTHFVLVKGPALEAYLLNFFVSGRLASFMRQLNYWGFSGNHDRWSNPHFRLPNLAQALTIKRKPNHWKRPKKQDAWEESKRQVETWNDPGILASVEFEFAQESALGFLDS